MNWQLFREAAWDTWRGLSLLVTLLALWTTIAKRETRQVGLWWLASMLLLCVAIGAIRGTGIYIARADTRAMWQSGASAEMANATVDRVHRGDEVTLRLNDGEIRRVWLAGIDAPYWWPVYECYSQDSAEHLRLMVDGERVAAMFREDGRAHLYHAGQWVNIEMVHAGMARVGDEPDAALREALEQAEAMARAKGAGAWGVCWQRFGAAR